MKPSRSKDNRLSISEEWSVLLDEDGNPTHVVKCGGLLASKKKLTPVHLAMIKRIQDLEKGVKIIKRQMVKLNERKN